MNKKNFLPILYPLNRDMAKPWFIKYKDSTGRPLKSYGQLNHLTTLKGRLKEAGRLIKMINAPGRIEKKVRIDLISNLTAVLEYKEPGLKHRSYTSYFSILKKFATWYRPEAARRKDLSPSEYIRHLQVLGQHNNHIRKIKSVLGSFFKELIRLNKYPVNPFESVRVKKVKAQSLLAFHPDQVAALKKTIQARDAQLWDAILFEYYLFMRPAEIRLLRIENILFEEMKLDVGVTITKDDDVLQKAIPMPMRSVFEKYRGLPGSWSIFGKRGIPGPQILAINNLNKRHRGFLDNMGISHRYALYSWVHTGIRQSAMSGIPHKQLQLQKGHSDLQMFDEYLKNIGVGDCVQLINNFPAI